VSAGSQGDTEPSRLAGKLLSHVDHDPSHGDDNSNGYFEQSVSNGARLCLGAVAMPRLHLDLLYEHVGGRGEQNPELIGKKARTTRAGG
jgi:hypothetical protein